MREGNRPVTARLASAQGLPGTLHRRRSHRPPNVAAARTAGDASGGPACGRARWSAALCTIPPPRLAHCALCLIPWTRQTGSRAKDTLPGSSARSWWLRTHPLRGLLWGRKPPAGQVQPGTARGESGVSRHKGWGRVGGAGWGSSREEERAGRTAIASTFASCPETSRGWRLGRQAKQLWPHIFVGNFPQTRVRWPLALTCPSLGEGRGGVFLGRGRESVYMPLESSSFGLGGLNLNPIPLLCLWAVP